MTDLRNKDKSCEFGTLTDSFIADRIVHGIQDDKLRERLLRIADLKLEDAVTTCKAAEQSKTHMAERTTKTKDSGAMVGVNAVTKNGTPGKPNFSNNCPNCGRQHPPKQCPTFGIADSVI